MRGRARSDGSRHAPGPIAVLRRTVAARAVRSSATAATRLDARWVFILPTRLGWIAAVALFGIFAAAANYKVSLGYGVAFLFAGIGLAAMVETWKNLLGIEIRLAGTDNAFAGESPVFRFRLLAGVRERVAIGASAAGTTAEVAYLPADAAADVSIAVPATHRGIVPAPRLALETRAPLGLFRAFAYVQVRGYALAYPRPALPGEPPPFDGGESRSAADAEDYVGPRPWRPGDSPRRVDWKAYARGRGLVSRDFAGGTGGRVDLDWSKVREASVEERLSRLARWALDAAMRGDAFSLRLPGLQLPAGCGADHLEHVLCALARFGSAS